MFKIDKTLVNNMNMNRSFIVITPKETPRDQKASQPELKNEPTLLDSDPLIPAAVRERAREMLLNAQMKSQQIFQSAAVRAEEIKNEARQEGYDAGMADAAQKISDMTEAQLEKTRTLIQEVAAYRDGLYGELLGSVLSLSMDVAEKIVNIQLQKDDRVYMEIAKKAVMGLKRADDFALRVGREEFDRFFKNGTQWLREAAECGEFEVVCDPDMEPGDLVIESDEEVVNAGVQMQLSKTRQYLKEQGE